MSFFITTLIVAAFSGFVVTRPGMRILNELCPKFFDRMDDIFTMGLKEGVYTYALEFGREKKELLEFETQLLLPLMGVSAGIALAFSWVAALFGGSTIACLGLALLGSLVPFVFGLVTLAVIYVMLRFPRLAGANFSNSAGTIYSTAAAHTEPYTVADRAYDFVIDRGEELKAFGENPRSLMTFLDDLYDAARARLKNKRVAAGKLLPRFRNAGR